MDEIIGNKVFIIFNEVEEESLLQKYILIDIIFISIGKNEQNEMKLTFPEIPY
jgi:hypothetical protein